METPRISPALVIACPLEAAEAWAGGFLSDTDLILHFPRTPEAFLYASLPDLSAWRNGLAQMVALWRQGAHTCILRTGTPVVAEHVLKIGARLAYQEPDKARYIVGPEGVNRYLARVAAISARWPRTQPRPQA